MSNITVAILSKNEEKNLKQLLPTLSFANEILVIDDYSTDASPNIAKKFKAKVINHALNNDFSAARQYALTHSRNEWVLFIDADERLSPELINWLKAGEPQTDLGGYSFRRRDWFWQQPLNYGEAGFCRLVRLVNKHQGRFKRPVHEVWDSEKPIFAVKDDCLINHYPHPTIASFLHHVNFYSTLNANYYYQQKRPANLLTLFFLPWFKFIYTYFCKLGFLDKAPGFIYSFMMSFHSFLTQAKLYQLQQHD